MKLPILLAVLILCAGGVGYFCEKDDQALVSIVVRSDVFRTVPGAPVELDGPDGSWQFVCDEHGQSPAVPVSASDSITVRLGETLVSQGVTIGQSLAMRSPDFVGRSSQRGRLVTRHVFQPLAVPVTIRPESEAYARPFHDRWVITGPKSAHHYELSMHVAILMSAREIRAYLAFWGLGADDLQGSRAVLIRSERQALPEEGLWLSIDCSEDNSSMGRAPGVTWALVASGDDDVTSGRVIPAVKEFDGSYAHVLLRGELGAGDNFILLSENDEPSDPIRRSKVARSMKGEAVPPPFCSPNAPLPPSGWKPEHFPAETWFGSGSNGAAALDSTDTEYLTTRIGGAVCGKPGEKQSWHIVTMYDGCVSVPVRYEADVASERSGHFELTPSSDTAKYQFEGGSNGSGQCKAEFVHEARLVQTWERKAMRLVPTTGGKLEFDESDRRIQTISIALFGPSSNTCDAAP